MTARPVLLLDVDGVLNKVGTRADLQGTEFKDFRSKECNGYEIKHSLEMGERIDALDCDIVWLTTWEHDANAFIGPLFGWGERPVIASGDTWYRRGWWKSRVLQEFMYHDPRPFIWLDDDLADAVRKDEVDWLDRFDQPRLLISPLTTQGLLPEHLDWVEAFLVDHTFQPPSERLV